MIQSILSQVARWFSPHTARVAGDPPASPNPFLTDAAYRAAHERQQAAQAARNMRAYRRATAAKRARVHEILAAEMGKPWPA